MGWYCAHPGARRIPRCQWGALPRKGTSLAPGRCQCTVAPSSRPPGASRSRGSTTGTLLRPRTMTRRRTDLVCRLALYPTVFSLFPLLMLTHTNRLSSGSFNTKNIDHCTIERKYRPSATFGKNHPLDKNRQDHTSGRKRPYRDILRLPVELDVKHNKRSNAGLRSEDSLVSTRSLSMSSLHDASRSTSMSRASSAYIKPITLRSRSKVREWQRRRDRLRREKGHGSWKMDSQRFHPSKIFLKTIEAASPAPGAYNVDAPTSGAATDQQHVTEAERHQLTFANQNQPFKSAVPRFMSNESMLHAQPNLPHDYVGRVGPGTYDPKGTYNDVIFENHLVRLERQRPKWLQKDNKRMASLMLQSATFLAPKREEAMLSFDKPKRWNMDDKRVDVLKHGHPSVLLRRNRKPPSAKVGQAFLLDLEAKERAKG